MSNWTRENELQRERVLALLVQKATPFDDPEGGPERRALPFIAPGDLEDKGWARTYLPHYFDRPFAPFHRRMIGAVGEAGLPTFVSAFRGAGKSVLLALARPLRLILEGACPFILFASQVQKLAAHTMSFLRLELENNPRIRCDYGEVEVTGPQEEWTAELPRAEQREFSACRVEAFGIGMSPRGRRFREHRPHEFMGDDLESAELARNPEREQQLWDWLMDEVVPALEPEAFSFTVLGTMFGPGCMMERAAELAGERDERARPLAGTFVQKVTHGPEAGPGLEGRSVWPDRFPDEALARIRQTIGLRNWLRNYALVAEDPTRPFQPGWMGTYEPADVDPRALDVVCFLDPAISEGPKGCPRALVAVGADRAGGARHVLDAWIERGSPVQMLDQLLAFHRRWRPRLIGIEKNGGYALIEPLLKMLAPNAWLPVRYVHHSQAKELRIERLAPQFEMGRWWFPKSPGAGVRTLQEQFLSYPQGFVDGPDACAGCDELLPDPSDGREFRYESLSRRTDMVDL